MITFPLFNEFYPNTNQDEWLSVIEWMEALYINTAQRAAHFLSILDDPKNIEATSLRWMENNCSAYADGEHRAHIVKMMVPVPNTHILARLRRYSMVLDSWI